MKLNQRWATASVLAFGFGAAVFVAGLSDASATAMGYPFEFVGKPSALNGRDIIQVRLVYSSLPKPMSGNWQASGRLLLLAQQSPGATPMTVAPSTEVPQEGSEQGVNPPDSLPRSSTPPSRVGQSAPPDVMVVSPRGLVPQGSQQGIETHNSMPMPMSSSTPRSRVPPSPPGPGVMVDAPTGVVPQTGSEQGARSPNSTSRPPRS